MRRVISLTFAACVLASPALADPAGKIMGYASIGAGWQWTHDAYEEWTFYRFAGDGAVNIPLSERFNLEFESSAEAQYNNISDLGHASANTFVHAYGRNAVGAFGLFGGYSNLQQYGNEHGNMLTAGAELQGYFGNLTLYGQVGYFDSSAVEDPYFFDFHGWFGRGTARYFVSPATRLQFDAQWMSIAGTYDHKGSVLTLIGTAEHQFTSAPFAGFASVRWDQVDSFTTRDFNAFQATIGMRFHFGGSAFDNDRGGATMDVIPMPTLFVRHVA
jgi:hypothetical protein